MMEPHATLAMWDGDKLTLHTSNQMLNQGVAAVARTLKMPPENVRLVSPFIGGGFGSKLWVNADAILAAIAARQLERPVKTALTRPQIFMVTTHRSDTIQHIRIGTDQNGRIQAIGHDVFSGNLPTEQTFEGGRVADPHAVCRGQPADTASPGAAGHSGCFVDARARRGGGTAGAGMRDGRAGGEAEPRPDRTAHSQ